MIRFAPVRAAFFAIAALAIAHHSHPIFYDACTSVTLEGTIESVEWKNPHVLLDIKATDGKAYRADWTSIGALERAKVAQPKAGDRVVIRGNPMRDIAAIKAKFPELTLEPPTKPVVDIVQVRGVNDNWSWARTEPATAPDCGHK